MAKETKPAKIATFQVSRETHNDATVLAGIEANNLNLGYLSANNYVKRLIAREKLAAQKAGTFPSPIQSKDN